MTKAQQIEEQLYKEAGVWSNLGRELLQGVKTYGKNIAADANKARIGAKNLYRLSKQKAPMAAMEDLSRKQLLSGAAGLGKRVGLPLMGAYVLGKD